MFLGEEAHAHKPGGILFHGEFDRALLPCDISRDAQPDRLTPGAHDEEDEFAEEAADYVVRELRRMAHDHADLEDVQDHARRAPKRFCFRWGGRKPLVSATVVET